MGLPVELHSESSGLWWCGIVNDYTLRWECLCEMQLGKADQGVDGDQLQACGGLHTRGELGGLL
jgi:hypothetical protein